MSTTCKHLERAAIRAHRGQQWPPPELLLPSTTQAIEQGRPPRQRSLFKPDDSREGRLRRLSSPPGRRFCLAKIGKVGLRELPGDATDPFCDIS